MKTIDKIPVGKLKRAGKIVKTGLKVGRNYASYYGEKLVNPQVSKDKLDRDNASEIMSSLKELKGGGLKVAQMLSMEKNLLPAAYVEQFSLAQFSVPPLSSPLVIKTFKKYFGKSPDQVFDTFNLKSKNAASIGQVHEAWKDGVKLAVKIQYPGVSESVQTDLEMIKPMASRLLRLKTEDSERYFLEVESKLIEETDYKLELENSMAMSEACSWMKGIVFPRYFPELSNDRIITMEWIEGMHLSEFAKSEASQEVRNELGQQLWDFYMYQLHELKKVHADPHPGNFIITPDFELGIIDFGCIKRIPGYFYESHVQMLDPEILNDEEKFIDILLKLELLSAGDTPDERAYYYSLYKELLGLALTPYRSASFDFSDVTLFSKMSAVGERVTRESLTSKFQANRGSEHFIYVNRIFFGLYNLLHLLKSEINTGNRFVSS